MKYLDAFLGDGPRADANRPAGPFDPTVPDAIDIPADHWRWRIANLPFDRWLRWRRRSGAIQAALGHRPSADEIWDADHQAAVEALDQKVTTP